METDAGGDAGVEVDAGLDAGSDAGAAVDAGADAGSDAGADVDAGTDAGADVDAGVDAGRPDGGCADWSLPLVFAPEGDGGLRVRLDVDTAGASNIDKGLCVFGGSGGRDVMFHFSLAEPKLFEASSTPRDGGDVTLFLREGACLSAPEVACVDAAPAGGAERLGRVVLDAGDYYLFVDNYDFRNNGVQTLEASLSAVPPVPLNDGCAAPTALTFDGGVAIASGDTLFADNSRQPTDGGAPAFPGCSPSAAITGHDVVYAFTVPAGPSQDVAVAVTSAGSLDAVVSVTGPGTCAATQGLELGCGAAKNGPLLFSSLGPGSYFVWVDGRNGTTGIFSLSVSMHAAAVAPDLCQQAVAVLDGGGAQTISGVTRGMQNNSTASCGPGAGQDVYYAFTTSTAQRFTAVARPLAGSTYRPLLYVWPATSCRPDGGIVVGADSLSPAGMLGCAAGQPASAPVRLEVSVLDAGSWILAVDGLPGTAGGFDLDLEVGPLGGAPGNDVCRQATPLNFTSAAWGLRAQVAGTLFGAANDYDAGCGALGPDVAFSMTTPSDGGFDGGAVRVKVSVWSENTVQATPSVLMQSGCDGGMLGCASPVGAQASLLALAEPGGVSRTLWVGNSTSSGGPFSLAVEVATAPPANDVCAGVVDLPLNTSVAGSTLGAENDYSNPLSVPDSGFYVGASCIDSLRGADLAYRFTSGDAGVYAVRVSPDRAFDPALAVTNSCASATCLGTADLGLSGDDEVLRINAAAGSTYFVFVDSFSADPKLAATRGGFVVSVTSP